MPLVWISKIFAQLLSILSPDIQYIDAKINCIYCCTLSLHDIVTFLPRLLTSPLTLSPSLTRHRKEKKNRRSRSKERSSSSRKHKKDKDKDKEREKEKDKERDRSSERKSKDDEPSSKGGKSSKGEAGLR